MRRAIGRRRLLAATGSVLAFPAIRARAQAAGVALVIGNSKYQWEASLPNVRRDAPDIARRFQALGLKTEVLQDIGRDAMRAAIDKFRSASRGATLAAFYFAGHGASWGKETYLVPMDADLSDPSTVQSLIPGPSVNAAMKEAAHRLIVFDNCRNNPADGWRQLESERLAILGRETPHGDADRAPETLVLFSTAPGRIALDGPAGENSPFAATLLRQLEGGSIDLRALPAKLRRDLLVATRGRQVVWDQNTYNQAFLLNGPRSGPPGAGDKSGWSSDPSRIVELTNAYAFAQANGLQLPPGLIAHRPPNASRDSQKVGAFNYVAQTVGSPSPRIIVVLSVEDYPTAQIVEAGSSRAAAWRFITATLSGDKLEYVPRDEGAHLTLTWSDANSGSVSQNKDQLGGRKRTSFNSRFTRLDG